MAVTAHVEMIGTRRIWTNVAVTEKLARDLNDDGLAALIGREVVLKVRALLAEEDQRNG